MKRLFYLALVLPLLACDLGRAPGTADIDVEGRGIVLEPYVGRGFMPPIGPEGSPLAVFVKLSAADSLPLPSGLAVDHAWVVKGLAIWGTDMLKDASWPEPWSAEFRGFGGPRWGPDIRVDVIVRVILPSGDSTRVRIPRCLIARSV